MKYAFFSAGLISVALILLFSFSAGAQTCPDNVNFKSLNGVCVPSQTGLSEKTVKEVMVAVLGWLFGIFGLLGIITFIISGIMYLTAAGDTEQEKKAKGAMKMGIMGVIVGLAGFVVIQAIDAVLNAQSGF